MAFFDLLLGGQRRQNRKRSLIDATEAPLPAIQPPRKLGIDTAVVVEPWSTARLATIFREAKRNPSAASYEDARHARHRLSQFWLAAPIDQLEILYSGSFGHLQRLVLGGPLIDQPVSRDERRWRQHLVERLQVDFAQPARLNLLLAAMIYVPSGTMRVEKPTSYLPEWLLEDYINFCDPSIAVEIRGPAGYLEAADATNLEARTIPKLTLPQFDERRGNQILEVLADATYVTRMQGLINLHVIDPEDVEVNQELADLRSLLSQLWLDSPSNQLDRLYQSAAGDLYQALLRSRFGAAPLSEADQARRAALLPLVADLSVDGAVQALLAAMSYFPPEKIKPAGGMDHLPPWMISLISSMSLLSNINSI